MALKGSSPISISALTRPASPLPQIAALKANANKSIFNSISAGIEKSRQRKIDAAEKASRIKVIENILNTPAGRTAFGDSPPEAKDIDVALGKDGQKDLVSILDMLMEANREEEKFIAERNKKAQEALFQQVREDLRTFSMTETGGLNVTNDTIETLVDKYKDFNLKEQDILRIGNQVINDINTIGNQKLEAEFRRDPNFRKYIEGLRTLDPKDTNLHDDLFDEKSVIAMLGGAGIGAGAIAAFTAFPITLGILGGAAIAGLGVAGYNALTGKEEFAREGFDLESINAYNEILFRNPEMIQAAGLRDIFDVLKAKKIAEANPSQTIQTEDGTQVKVFGGGISDPRLQGTLEATIGGRDINVQASGGGGRTVNVQSRPGKIQFMDDTVIPSASTQTIKQLTPSQIRMLRERAMMDQVPGV